MREIVMVHVSGQDRPGLTAALTGSLARYGVDILDMGQAVIHDTLLLGIMIHIPRESESAPILKDLLFTGHELGVTVRFTPITVEDYHRWVAAQGKKRFIVTLLARRITSSRVGAISAAIAEEGLNIDVITRLSGRPPLTEEEGCPRRACVEFSVRGTPRDADALRRRFMELAAEHEMDIAFQEDTVFRRNRRIVAFDMDSTLIQAEVIDELAEAAGAGAEVKAITESAMRGEIDFKESLRRRLSKCAGLPVATLEEIAERLPLTEGAERLIKNLKRVGYTVAIISGGFTYFGNRLKERLGVDFVFANELEIEDGKLTGRVVGGVVDAARKAELLAELARRENISLQQVIAVGDGANDLPMLSLAGLGIAFHAKPKVREEAGHCISTLGLDSILYLMGMRDRETA